MGTMTGNDRTQRGTEPRRDAPQGQNAPIQRTQGKEASRSQEEQGRPVPWSAYDYGIRNPYGVMRRMMEDMDQVVGGGLGYGSSLTPRFDGLPQLGVGGGSLWHPQIEVFEKDNNLIVRADLPGVEKDAVQLRVDDDVLFVSGERRNEREESREGWYHSERSYGSFQRGIQLPPGVDPDAIEASFESGVLEVKVPIPENKSRGRSISIGEGKGKKLSGNPQVDPMTKLRGSS